MVDARRGHAPRRRSRWAPSAIPIRGRLIDLEGRPVAGIKLRAVDVASVCRFGSMIMSTCPGTPGRGRSRPTPRAGSPTRAWLICPSSCGRRRSRTNDSPARNSSSTRATTGGRPRRQFVLAPSPGLPRPRVVLRRRPSRRGGPTPGEGDVQGQSLGRRAKTAGAVTDEGRAGRGPSWPKATVIHGSRPARPRARALLPESRCLTSTSGPRARSGQGEGDPSSSSAGSPSAAGSSR